MTIRLIRDLWHELWFAPQSPVPIAIFRILLGLTLLEYAVLIVPDLSVWFGKQGILSNETAKLINPFPCVNVFAYLADDDLMIRFAYCTFLCAALSFTLGLWTRASAIISYICLASFHFRNPLIINSGDILICLALFYMIFSPAGNALSIDRLRRIWKKKDAEFGGPLFSWPVSQRLIQLQIGVIYFQAFWSKMDGNAWLNGTAIYWVLKEKEFARFPIPFVCDQPWMYSILTWGTLAIELSLWSLIWIKEFRYPVILAGSFLHLGIDYAMNLPMFETMMIFSYIVFVPASDINKAAIGVRSLRPVQSSQDVLFYSKKSGFSVRFAETIRRLDVFRQIRLIEFDPTDIRLRDFPQQVFSAGLALVHRGNFAEPINVLPTIANSLLLTCPAGYVLGIPAVKKMASAVLERKAAEFDRAELPNAIFPMSSF